MVFCIAVAMILTSVGVFGFLSKAHVMQTALGDESVAQVVRIETEVVRQRSIIERAGNKIQELEGSGSNADKTIQNQIDNEQTRMDSAARRTQPAIDEQNAIITDHRRTTLAPHGYVAGLGAVAEQTVVAIERCTGHTSAGRIARLQSVANIGVIADERRAQLTAANRITGFEPVACVTIVAGERGAGLARSC